MPSAPTYATDPQILANALTEPELGSSNRILATVPPLKKPTPFKTTTNGWEAIPILPGPHPPTRRSHSGTLYPPSTPSAAPSLITSFGFHSTSTIDILPLKDVWSFNLHTSQWALVWQGEGMERGSHVTAVYGDTLFSFGGLIYSNNNRWANEAVAEIKTLPLNPDGVYPETGTTESWSTIPLSADITPRGESASGTWYDSADSPNLIIMGGLSITGSSITAHSDTYSFHLPTRTFTALTIANSASNRPTPRFSHAGTVVGDMFVVHGGRSMQEGRERWFMLEDCWALDLRTQEWTELTDLANGPSISRSYHAMVTAANNKDFYAFGGYRTVSSKGTQVAYVFSDLFSNTVVTSEEVDESTSSNVRDEERVLPRVKEWLKFSPTNGTLNGVDVRFQHVAVVYENTMILHGGRFQDTNDVTEMWAINISNIPSKAMVLATEDGLDDGYVALKTLHLVVAVMLMVVLLFIALFGVLRRRIVMEGGHGDGAALFRGVNAGLDQNFIDTIPVVKYRKKAGGDSAESSAAHGATIAVNDDDANSVHSEDDEDVCPICLCSLDEGSDVNVLPCDHVFHPECVGTWLKRNATCPACRQSLRTLMAGGRGRREGRGGGTGGRAVEIEMSVISSTRREEAETNI